MKYNKKGFFSPSPFTLLKGIINLPNIQSVSYEFRQATKYLLTLTLINKSADNGSLCRDAIIKWAESRDNFH